MPKDVLDKLHAAAAHGAQSEELKKRLAPDGSKVVGGTPSAFKAFMFADIENWKKVVKVTGAKPE